MRKPFTTAEFLAAGFTKAALKWGVKQGRWQRVISGVYINGGPAPIPLERAVCVVMATSGVASHALAGRLHGLDGIELRPPFATVAINTGIHRHHVVRRELDPAQTVLIEGIRCTDGLRTLLDLSAFATPDIWEQALEFALRRQLVTIDAIQNELAFKRWGNPLMRSVLDRRGQNVPATDSLLETLAIQLLRADPAIPEPRRQVEVWNESGAFVARVDLAWPEIGAFVELDGEWHKGQPVYDAIRQNAVVIATGWLPQRLTWTQVTRHPQTSLRSVAALLGRAAR